jgi:hypothetical protein
VGWDGEGRERKGEEGRDGKRAGGKYCFMAVGGDGRHCILTSTMQYVNTVIIRDLNMLLLSALFRRSYCSTRSEEKRR